MGCEDDNAVAFHPLRTPAEYFTCSQQAVAHWNRLHPKKDDDKAGHDKHDDDKAGDGKEEDKTTEAKDSKEEGKTTHVEDEGVQVEDKKHNGGEASTAEHKHSAAGENAPPKKAAESKQ